MSEPGEAGGSQRSSAACDNAMIAVEFTSTVVVPTIGILIRDRVGNDVFGTNSFHVAPIEAIYEPGEALTADFDVP